MGQTRKAEGPSLNVTVVRKSVTGPAQGIGLADQVKQSAVRLMTPE
jgi:hypothetical protein